MFPADGTLCTLKPQNAESVLTDRPFGLQWNQILKAVASVAEAAAFFVLSAGALAVRAKETQETEVEQKVTEKKDSVVLVLT
ncbi:MAG TPA: hypothetical protein PK054_02420 [Anaerohalosphaeraceae bacterium]|nr:hypothetical protein [Anaerohalosphaeraceae bacterium]HOL87915.1 hypothetical protein [Anaerohalosphaeraceae bacterium]HPP55414.1 hypothetical protein [Anaerohalosphaeraceae bacterium]